VQYVRDKRDGVSQAEEDLVAGLQVCMRGGGGGHWERAAVGQGAAQRSTQTHRQRLLRSSRLLCLIMPPHTHTRTHTHAHTHTHTHGLPHCQVYFDKALYQCLLFKAERRQANQVWVVGMWCPRRWHHRRAVSAAARQASACCSRVIRLRHTRGLMPWRPPTHPHAQHTVTTGAGVWSAAKLHLRC
jgi:hypothetical protein